MSFEALGLTDQLVRAVRAKGYQTATPIQLQSIPTILEGRDLMGCAQTGTGKTAAFALPTLQKLAAAGVQKPKTGKAPGRPRRHAIRTLVLAPTRELAAQIEASFSAYGKHTGLRCAAIYGGVSQGPQVKSLQAGVDILVATPGRLLDLMNQGYIDLATIEILILDEADQMLDMGFLPDLRRIVSRVPERRQTLMFSATMPDEIRRLAGRWLSDPKFVAVAPVATPAEQVSQSVYLVESHNKPTLLAHFLRKTACTRTLVFARTKHGADRIVKQLVRSGIHAVAIHGNKSQNARTRTLAQFKSNRPPVLVATDIAARGLDVDLISHVINYELPEVPEIYVHRIGRTGRGGATGIATSFCGADERGRLQRIERLTRQAIAIADDHPEYSPSSRITPQVSVGESRGQQSKTGNQRRRQRTARPPRTTERTATSSAGRPQRKRRQRRAHA